ncbi:6932_t:CDS:2 [Entrophospora sp. SA101]|nr:6932_t:CDS:2 [Entrophospora sp. SA101]
MNLVNYNFDCKSICGDGCILGLSIVILFYFGISLFIIRHYYIRRQLRRDGTIIVTTSNRIDPELGGHKRRDSNETVVNAFTRDYSGDEESTKSLLKRSKYDWAKEVVYAPKYEIVVYSNITIGISMALSNKNADNTDELSPRTPKKNSQLCNGISTSGKHCKRLVANGEYCGYHKTNSILEDIGIKNNYTMLKKTNLLVELSSSERITSDSLSNNSLVDCENKDVASSLKIGLKTSTIQSIDNPSRDSVDSIDDDYIFAPIESPPNDISESPIVLGDDNKKLEKKKDNYDEVDWFKTSSLNNTKYYNSSFYKSLKSVVTLEENHIDSIVDKFNTLYIDEKNNLNCNVIDKEFAESISPYDLTPKKNGILETKTLTSYKKTPSSHEKPKRSTLVDDNFDVVKSPNTYVTPTRLTSLFSIDNPSRDSVDSIDDDYIFAPIESPPNDISESPIVLGDDNKKLEKKKDNYDEVDWFKTSSLNNTKYYNSSFYKSLKSVVTLEENHIDSIVDKFNTLYIDEKNNLNCNVIDKEFAESISPYDLTPKKNGILETKTLTSYKKTPSSHEKPKRSTLVDDNFDVVKSPNTYVTPTRLTSLFVNFDQIEDDLLSSCSPSKSSKNFQCNGYTQNGKKCKNKIKASQYYCYNHKPEKSKIDLENLFIPTNDTNGIWIRTDGYINKDLSHNTKNSLRLEMEKKISISDEAGYIYIYRVIEVSSHSTQNCIHYKVGRTKNIIRRLNEWKNQCKYKLKLIDWFPSTGGLLISQKTENADEINGNDGHKDLERQKIMKSCKFTHRAERLIHLELSEKFKAESSKCLFCEKIHREIFKIDITSVVETTETKVKTAETALIKDDKELPGLEEIRNVIIKWVKYIEEVYGPD